MMAYGADIHGELTSQAYMDIMYPAGQFDSVDHRRLMAIAERTKSVIDKTLYAGIVEEFEENATTATTRRLPQNDHPAKPAHWATVWDTLGYTDTGFIGDYMATDLGVTGMDYEIAFNHTVPEKMWNVYLQENHINASRGIIKTAMAYALLAGETTTTTTNVRIDPRGPRRLRRGRRHGDRRRRERAGPAAAGPSRQRRRRRTASRSSSARTRSSNQQWFRDTNRLMTEAVRRRWPRVTSPTDPEALDVSTRSCSATCSLPRDPGGRAATTKADYWAQHPRTGSSAAATWS